MTKQEKVFKNMLPDFVKNIFVITFICDSIFNSYVHSILISNELVDTIFLMQQMLQCNLKIVMNVP